MADVATRLRMGVRQIDALERGEYTALPTGTFLRGFVRNYAKVVNVDGERAIRLLEKCNAEAARLKAAVIVVPSQDIQIRTGGSALSTPKGRIAVYAVVIAFLAAAVTYWWQFIRPNLATAGRSLVVPTPAIAPATPPALTGRGLLPAETAAPGAAAGNPSQIETGLPVAPVAPALPSAAVNATKSLAAPAAAVPEKPAVPRTVAANRSGQVLGFTFSGDCWVEVTDADGRVLLSRQYHEGDTGEVRSNALPLSVVFGNAQNARMAHNGKELDLAPFTRISVARVTIK